MVVKCMRVDGHAAVFGDDLSDLILQAGSPTVARRRAT